MRYLAAAVLAILFAGAASSQGRFGIKAGVVINYINTEGDGGSFSDVKTGFTGGVSYTLPVTSCFTIQPELNFVSLQSEESLTSSTIDLDYFQLPVLLKAVNKKQNFSAYIGPQLSFLTNATSKSASGKTDITSDVTETHFDGVIGIEFVTPINITINARYVHGMSNVFKAEYDSFKSRHQYIGLTVGYLFRSKAKQ